MAWLAYGVGGMELPGAASIRGLAARLGWKMPAACRSSAVSLVLGQLDDLVQAFGEVVDRHLNDGVLFLDGGSCLFGGFQRRV
jgi:hypothetical protein